MAAPSATPLTGSPAASGRGSVPRSLALLVGALTGLLSLTGMLRLTAGVFSGDLSRFALVVVLLAEGLNAPDIAARLHISPSTATAHIKAALQRLGAVNRAHAIALAVMAGELILPRPETGSPEPAVAGSGEEQRRNE